MLVRTFGYLVKATKVRGNSLNKREMDFKLYPVVFDQSLFLVERETLEVRSLVPKVVEVGDQSNSNKQIELVRNHGNDDLTDDFFKKGKVVRVMVFVVVLKIAIVAYKKRDFRIVPIRMVSIGIIKEGVFPVA